MAPRLLRDFWLFSYVKSCLACKQYWYSLLIAHSGVLWKQLPELCTYKCKNSQFEDNHIWSNMIIPAIRPCSNLDLSLWDFFFYKIFWTFKNVSHMCTFQWPSGYGMQLIASFDIVEGVRANLLWLKIICSNFEQSICLTIHCKQKP